MDQLHQLQREIIKKLIFSPTLRYMELKPNELIENNQFDFHLDRLISYGFIQKGDQGYFLTPIGKEFSSRFDTDQVKIIKQAKISAWMACMRDTKKGYEFLIYTRLKQPFYGCQGFCGGKVNYGEKIFQTASRELKEETGLVGSPELVHIQHYLVRNIEATLLLEDKIMFLFRFINPTGDLISQNEEGKYEWIAEHDIDNFITKPFETISALHEQIHILKNQKHLSFNETDHFNDKY